jgi:hypothetical protein
MVPHTKELMAVSILFQITNNKMKTQNRLEKILSSVKNISRKAGRTALDKTAKFCRDNYRTLVLTALTAAWAVGGAGGAYSLDKMMVGEANAGNLKVTHTSYKVTGTSTYLKHIAGATEGWDFGVDSHYVNSPNVLQIYSNNSNCLPDPNLSTDARDYNSITTYNLELASNGFTSPPLIEDFLTFKFDGNDSTNFEWKNIFLGDVNNSETIAKDIKRSIVGEKGIYQMNDLQGTTTGVYDKRKIMFYNYADLNRTGNVDFQDFTIFASVFGKSNVTDPNRFGGDTGKDPNDFSSYADMNRDGAIDNKDLCLFSSEWLFNKEDPNTW